MVAILYLKMADQKCKRITLKSLNHKQQLYSEICQFFDDKFMVDIDVTCHGNQTKVHSLMLAIFCPILRESLVSLSSGLETKDNVDNSNPTLRSLNLDYVAGRPEDMDFLIEFIYRGEVAVPSDRLKGLLETASSLGVIGLVKAIQKITKEQSDAEKAGSETHETSPDVHVAPKRPGGRGRPPKRKRQFSMTPNVTLTNKGQRQSVAVNLVKEPIAAEITEKPVRFQPECSLPPKRRFRHILERENATEPELSANGCTEGVTIHISSDTECVDDLTNDTGDGGIVNESAEISEDVEAEQEVEGGEIDERSPDVVGKKETSVAKGKSVRKKRKQMPSAESKSESRKLWRLTRPVMKCDHCDYETRDKGSFKSHIAKHDPEADRFVCDVCSKTFRSKRGYRCHTRSHYEPEQLHKCNHCEFHTPQKWSWLQHLAVIHKVDPKGNPLSEDIKCQTCNKTFVAEHQLKAHMIRKHTVDKPYKCNQCPYASVIKYELDKHISIKHNNERRYMCELCSFRSQTQSGFERHKRSHTGVKPFGCPICGKMYADNRKLKSHLLRHENDEKSWVCHLCGHACRRKDNLQMHLKRIHKTTMESGSFEPQDQSKDQNSDSVLLHLGDPTTCANITLCIPNSPQEMVYDAMNPSADTTSVAIHNLMVYEEDNEAPLFKDHAGDQLAVSERSELQFAVVVETSD